MYTKNHLTPLIASILLSGCVYAQSTELQAVSIVFTSPDRVNTVDTVIEGGDRSLHNLLAEHELTQDDVHLLFLDEIAPRLAAEERKEIIMIHTEDVVAEGDQEEVKSMRIIRVDGEETNLEDLEAEERALVEAQMSREEAVAMQQDGHAFRKVIEIKEDGDGGEKQAFKIRIEESSDGEETQKMIWVNDEEMSEEQLNVFMQEHDVKIEQADGKPTRMRFEGKGEEVREIRIEKEIETSAHEAPKAIVIVKHKVNEEAAVSALGLSTEMHVYPNPAKQSTSVSFKPALNDHYRIQVTGLDGKVVLQKAGAGKNVRQVDLTVDGLTPGTYIISAEIEEGIISRKLVVE